MFGLLESMTERISNIIKQGANSRLSDKEFLENEIAKWKISPQRMMQIKGHLYYNGEHDILKRKRTAIGEGGKETIVNNIPNNKIIDNQYAKIADQKTNYLLGKPFVIEGENEKYISLLKNIFDKRFMRTMKNVGREVLNGGIAWLYPYYDADGKFTFRMFPSYEILPFWEDSEHTILDFAVRLYLVEGYEGINPVIIEKAEIYTKDGIYRYILDNSVLIEDISEDNDINQIIISDENGNKNGFNWQRIPLIPIKYNEQEMPLLKKVKSLQDGINTMLSDFENNMQEDARNTILVIKNYDGEDLGEFRKNLSTYGAVKVRTVEGAEGGIDTLQISVNSENYKSILDLLKKALIENAMGYDAKSDKIGANPNQMNIQSMYSDIDLDANNMETELQAAFEDILWFVNAHLANTGQGNFENEKVNITFNRDILINETEAIEGIQKSVGILSDETLVEMHPWVNDVQQELNRLKKQHESDYNPAELNEDKDSDADE